MGQAVPTMLRPRAYGSLILAGALVSPNDMRAQWVSQIGSGHTPVLEGSPRYRIVGPCTQCGAPDETGAHVCAYCLSPRQDDQHGRSVEQFERNYAEIQGQQRYSEWVRRNPIAQPEPDRR